jgi:beta-glucanase (GH16 family)
MQVFVIPRNGRSAPAETRRVRLAVLVALGILLAVPASFGGPSRSGSTGQVGFDAGTVIPPTPFGPAGWWELVFADEFDRDSLDATRWQTCFWWATTTCSIESNRELELYDPSDVAVSGGVLRLRAQRRDLVGWNGATYHYSSGMVMSGARRAMPAPGFIFTYGYAEARVRVPKGRGLWPGFWLLPASHNSRPEIDAMEILGDSTGVQHMNFHYLKADGDKADAGMAWAGPDFSAGWHSFGVDWEPSSIVWYVDGVERWRFADPSVIPREPMYLLANLAVGGSWPGNPDADTPFPSSYDVDYIRVWQSSPIPPAAFALIPADATWRYLDDGSDQASAWRAVDFDDSSWQSGPATLGYGQGDESTIAGYGDDPANKYLTTYFRRSFSVPDPAAIAGLTLELRQDDGAVVYLNGSEIYRSSMPSGAVTSRTPADGALDDGSRVRSASVDSSLLRAGVNTVAVEVHQATPDSSDLTMQLELAATAVTAGR